MKYPSLLLTAVILATLAAWASGCTNPRHSHPDGGVRPAEGQPLQCQLCYDETVRVRKSYAHPKGATRQYVTIKKHRCPDCQTDVEFYAQDGKTMIKCARCAPDGLPCDQCLPPKSGS